jgi:hypothetical protein
LSPRLRPLTPARSSVVLPILSLPIPSLRSLLERAGSFDQRLEAERARISAMTAEELKVDEMRRHVVDRLLTLACPRCSAAFVDFNGCFAVTCHRCSCGFCGWCLADCGADAHQHVPRCVRNGAGGSVYGTAAAFGQAQQERRRRLVREYLDTLPDERLRKRLLAACAQDMADLGIGDVGA